MTLEVVRALCMKWFEIDDDRGIIFSEGYIALNSISALCISALSLRLIDALSQGYTILVDLSQL